MSVADKLTTIAENEQKVYEAGQKAEYDRFWDEYQDYGNRIVYMYAFSYGWTDETCKPKYLVKPRNVNYMFQGSHIVNAPTIDCSVAQNLDSIYRTATYLESAKLIGIPDTLTYNLSFAYANKLTHLVIEGVVGQDIDFQWNPLDHDSIVNIVDVLSSNATGKTLTLSLSAVNNAFETAEGLADGSTSQEWKDLIATKTNWTISLI